MSESTTTETASEQPAEAAPALETQPGVETAPPAAETTTDAPQHGPQNRGDRRFAALTAKAAADHARLEEVERELEATKALLAAKEGGEPAKPSTQPDAVRAEAVRLLERERQALARQSLIQNGVKEFGEAAWNEKTSLVAALGATRNEAFMEALAEAGPEAHKLVVALADDPDRLQSLLTKRATAMAAELGRMAAEIAAPKPKPISNAPAPVKPISGRGGALEPTLADTDKMSVADWIKMRNKQAPAHLGGVRRRA